MFTKVDKIPKAKTMTRKNVAKLVRVITIMLYNTETEAIRSAFAEIHLIRRPNTDPKHALKQAAAGVILFIKMYADLKRWIVKNIRILVIKKRICG